MRISAIFVSYVLVTVLNLYCKLYHRIARYAHEGRYKIACNFKQKPPYSERLRCSIISSSAVWAGKIKRWEPKPPHGVTYFWGEAKQFFFINELSIARLSLSSSTLLAPMALIFFFNAFKSDTQIHRTLFLSIKQSLTQNIFPYSMAVVLVNGFLAGSAVSIRK